MATTTETPLQSTRTRPEPAPAIMSRADGLFIGVVLLFVGTVWFLDTAEVINIAPKFGELVVPGLLAFAGLYLVFVKLVRH